MSLVAMALAVGLAGCGGGGGAPPNPKTPRVDASGKVDFDGKPIPAGTVNFYHVASGTPATCVISDGTYSSASGEGPVVGENAVTVAGADKAEDGTPLWTGNWTKTVTVDAAGYKGDFAVKTDEIVAPKKPEPSRVDN